MRLIEQPAVVEWFPATARTTMPGTKINHTPQRRSFETVAEAVRFVMTTLSARDMPEINADNGITLSWEAIEAMGKLAARNRGGATESRE